jgi:hypothetical protein
MGKLQPVPLWTRIPALIFTVGLPIFFVAAFFWVPTLTPDQRGILCSLFAIFAGFAVSFLGGSAMIKIDVPHNGVGKLTLSATAGIAVFIFTYVYAPYWFEPSSRSSGESTVNEEKVDARLESPTKDDVAILSMGIENQDILYTWWKCSLSNNGGVRLSILEYKLFSAEDMTNNSEVEREDHQRWYKELDGGMYDVDRRPMQPPLVLEPGESKIVFFKIGLDILRPAHEILRKHFSVETPVKYMKMRLLLAEHKIDIYGNKVAIDKESPDSSDPILGPHPDSPYKGQIIRAVFRTGRKNKFEALTAWDRSARISHRNGKVIPIE